MEYPEPEIADPVEANCIYIDYSEYLLLFIGSGIGWFLIGYYIPNYICWGWGRDDAQEPILVRANVVE